MSKLDELVRRPRSPEKIQIMESVEGAGHASVSWFVKDITAKQCEEAVRDLLELARALREKRTREIIEQAMNAARKSAPDKEWED